MAKDYDKKYLVTITRKDGSMPFTYHSYQLTKKLAIDETLYHVTAKSGNRGIDNFKIVSVKEVPL